jgi:hypothetical protein
VRYFLIAAAIVYGAAAAISISQSVIRTGDEGTLHRVIALNVFIIPLLSAWAALELARLIRGPRLFDRRLKRPVARFGLGLLAAGAGATLATVALPWVDRLVSDGVTTGVAAAIPSFALVAMLPAARRGRCIYCTYDLTTGPAPGQPGFGLCPECGAPVTSA